MNEPEPNDVGTFAVVRHMLLGVVGVLLCVAAVGLFFALRPVSTTSTPGVSPIPATLAPGEVALGRLDGRPRLAEVANQLTLTVQRTTSGSRVLLTNSVTQAQPLFGGTTSQAVVLAPMDPSAGPLDMEALLVEFAADLDRGLALGSSASGSGAFVPGLGHSYLSLDGSTVMQFDFEDVEGLIVQYAPPGTTAVEEWRLIEDGFGVRFERYSASSTTPSPILTVSTPTGPVGAVQAPTVPATPEEPTTSSP
jgi:hypothetical protein